MMKPTLHARPSAQTAAFVIAALLTLGTGWFTMLDHIGPSVAAAWSATALGAGQSVDAGQAPLFRLLLQAAALFGPDTAAHLIAGLVTVLGWALLAGSLAGLLTALFQRWQVWSAFSAGTVGAVLVVLARLSWAAALTPNPAPWALAALAAAWWALLGTDDDEHGRRAALFGALAASLAVAFHAAALIAWPATLALVEWKARRTRTPNGLVYLALALPFALFFLPKLAPVFEVAGLLASPQGIPNGLAGYPLLGWAALHTFSFVGLLFAIHGAAMVAKRHRGLVVPLLLLLAGIAVAPLIGANFGTFGAILLSVVVMALAVIALADLVNRLPRGLVLAAWLLLPLAILLQGNVVSRHGEAIWDAHVRNMVSTARYKSVILSTDDATVNAAARYLQASGEFRPDVILVNPLKLTNPGYLAWVDGRYGETFGPARPLFDSLRNDANAGMPGDSLRALARQFVEAWVQDEVATSDQSGGVLVSAGYDPGTQYSLVPEGLLMRVWKGDTRFPFVFRLLNLDPIHYGPDQTPLERHVIALYPMMFTARGTWLIKEGFMPEGTDYIRYALKIDKHYTPAQIVADEYGIYGDPMLLNRQ